MYIKNKLSIQFIRKYFLFLIMFSFALFGVSYYVILQEYRDDAKQDIIKNVDAKVAELKKLLQESQNLVLTLSKEAEVRSYLDQPNERLLDTLHSKFRTVAKIYPQIMQLRVIDKNGYEKVRVDKEDSLQADPLVMPQQRLQDKKDRYYFKETRLLNEGQFYVSDIDLNIEQGKIELPYKPTLRIATPVYMKGSFNGIVIVNLYMKDFLDRLRGSKHFNIYLFNDKGAYLLHENRAFDWSNHFHPDKTLFEDFPKLADTILRSALYQNSILISKHFVLDNQKKFIVLLSAIDKHLDSKFYVSSFWTTMLIIIAFLVLFGLLSNKYLVHKLNKLNVSMQAIIYQQIKELREKDAFIENQSRLATMGEMLSMIAHQWRQPLAAIASISSNIHVKHELGCLEAKDIKHNCKKIDEQASYLSSTINDFSEFLKPNTEHVEVALLSEVQNAIKLILPSLKNNDIVLEADLDKSCDLMVVKGEFQQVIINIINNAKDAILEQKKDDGRIAIKLLMVEGHWVLSVCDNGGGISEEIIQNIFDPYFSTKAKNGTGLGLYMSSMIVKKHTKGSLEVENIDKGVCFSITF